MAIVREAKILLFDELSGTYTNIVALSAPCGFKWLMRNGTPPTGATLADSPPVTNRRRAMGKMFKTIAASLLLLGAAQATHAALVTYGLGVTALTPGPSTYTFSFGSPTVPYTGVVDLSFDGHFALADMGVPGDASLTIGALPQYWRLIVGSDAANAVTVADVGGVAAFAGDGATHDFSTSMSFDCANVGGTCAFLAISSSFALTGLGDQVSGTGRLEIQPSAAPLPEPGTLGLLAGALGMLGLAQRRTAPRR